VTGALSYRALVGWRCELSASRHSNDRDSADLPVLYAGVDGEADCRSPCRSAALLHLPLACSLRCVAPSCRWSRLEIQLQLLTRPEWTWAKPQDMAWSMRLPGNYPGAWVMRHG
jgi:hypothetical protein